MSPSANADIAWPEQMPVRWRVQPLKHNSYARGRVGWQNLRSDEYVETGPYLVTGMHFRQGRVDWASSYHVTEARYDLAPEIQLREGDVLLTKDGTVGKLAYVDSLPGPACLNSHVLLLRPRRDSYRPRFLFYVLSGPAFTRHVELTQTGTTFQGISQESVLNFPMILPPLKGQDCIVAFLDRKTGAIDHVIRQKERLIELLQEQRRALITQAVTKGLDPSVPMNGSGIDWIGLVPRHWQVAPLYSRFTVQLGKMLDSSRHDGSNHYPYLRNANVYWRRLDLDDIKTMPFSPADRARYRLRSGDLLVCEGGANINVVGKSAIWRGELGECYYQKALHRVRSRGDGALVEFLLYALWAAFAQGVFIADANANTVFHLTAEKLRQHRFAFPPASEQERIVQSLDRATQRLDEMVARTKESVRRLGEYRQALISAAVTGQIDVTGEAA